MHDTLARIASISLGVAFAWAAVAKMVAFGRWRSVLGRYGLPVAVARAGAPLVPLAELGIAVVIVGVSTRLGAITALAALALFSLAILRARSINGDRLPCGCFGGSNDRHYRTMMLRNSALGMLAAIVLLADHQDVWLPPVPTTRDLLPLALAVTGGALILWIAWQTSAAMRKRGDR